MGETSRSGAVEDAPVLAAEGVLKRFDGIKALDGARLSIAPGEIHALLGENGAGKSTLIKVLTGVLQPDEGSIDLGGRPAQFASVRAAHRAGVVALYQELSIIPTLSVAENIVLGQDVPRSAGFVRWKRLRAQAQAQLDRLGQDIPLGRLAGNLSPVRQTMVAVARALATDARVLILDEPTAALTDTEIESLFRVLRGLRAQGVSILYVSHRLDEVFELCDRYTVMRNGRTIVTRRVADASVDDVITSMVGYEAGELYPPRSSGAGPLVLAADDVHGRRVRGVSLTAHAGEIVGVGGLAGSGRSELLRLLAGAQRRTSGTVLVDGRPMAPIGVGRALDSGIAYVPEERRAQGVDVGASVQDNIALPNLGLVSTGGWMSRRRVAELARGAIDSLRIKTRGPRQPVGLLSGGNQQKVVLAKVLARRPRLLLVDEPTRGIDVGARAEIYRLIRELASGGTAVVVVSSDLPELIGLSDRILIVHQGRIAGEVPAAEADDEVLLSYSYGRA